MAVIECAPGEIGMRLRMHEQETQAKLKAAVLESAFLGAEVVAQAAPKDMGILKQSVHVERLADGGAEVVVDAPHAGAIENGTRPHTPPLAPLLAWASRHFDPKDAERVARAVQMQIANYGTGPRFFVKGSLPKMVKLLDAVVARAVASGNP